MVPILRAQTVPGGTGGSQVFLHPPNSESGVQYYEENGWLLLSSHSSIVVILTVLQIANSIHLAQTV